ncbi:snaclec lebecin subunit beta-like [Oppia nitens]|uniref:snaclec lebecin subunit beta-like n=1 Tax=Oppia nitens TaxID=1686743 RepID=UPI0023DC7356|nr:snaclec lebecin subunit beta-like [Oppia nitens]
MKQIILVLSTLISITYANKPFVCKDDIHKCYYVLNGLSTENEAKNHCKQMDTKSQLLTINSKEEQQFISSALASNPSLKDNVWLGLEYGYSTLPHTVPRNLRWRWDNRVDSQYFNWCPGRNCAFDDEDARNWGDCARMSVQKGSSLGLWYSHPCTAQLGVVCEIISK